jgi:hypothetical protein
MNEPGIQSLAHQVAGRDAGVGDSCIDAPNSAFMPTGLPGATLLLSSSPIDVDPDTGRCAVSMRTLCVLSPDCRGCNAEGLRSHLDHATW